MQLVPFPAPDFSKTYIDDLVFRGGASTAIPLANPAAPPLGANNGSANVGANQPDGSYYQPFDPNGVSAAGAPGPAWGDPAPGDKAMATIASIFGDGWQGQPPGATGAIGDTTEPALANVAAAGTPDQAGGSARSPYCPAGADQCWPTMHSRMTGAFGEPRKNLAPHDGLDIRSRLGDPIYSVERGTILGITRDPRGGNQIFIQNGDGSLSGYAHTGPLDSLRVGQSVQAGEQIGMSDGSGTPHSHLHYTYRPPQAGRPATRSDRRVDPFSNQLDDLALPPNS